MEKRGLGMGLLFFLVVSFAVYGVIVFKNIAESTRSCIPFAQKDVPDHNDGTWQAGESLIESYRTAHFYKHRTFKGLYLVVYDIFGEHAYKSWSCENSDGANGTERADRTFAVLVNGKWIKTKPGAKKPYISEIHGQKGMLIGVELASISETNELIHIIYRPK